MRSLVAMAGEGTIQGVNGLENGKTDKPLFLHLTSSHSAMSSGSSHGIF